MEQCLAYSSIYRPISRAYPVRMKAICLALNAGVYLFIPYVLRLLRNKWNKDTILLFWQEKGKREEEQEAES